MSLFCNSFGNWTNAKIFINKSLDKKNENKEVAVDDFLPAAKAYEAVQHSM